MGIFDIVKEILEWILAFTLIWIIVFCITSGAIMLVIWSTEIDFFVSRLNATLITGIFALAVLIQEFGK